MRLTLCTSHAYVKTLSGVCFSNRQRRDIKENSKHVGSAGASAVGGNSKMKKFKLALTHRKLEFNISLDLSREEGIKKLKELLEEEISQKNQGCKYRIIGSIAELKPIENINLIVENQSGNTRFDVISAKFDIQNNTTFELKGYVENKCKIYGELGILLFLIGYLIYLIPTLTQDNFMYALLFLGFIIWIGFDVYSRPTNALRFLETKLRTIKE